MISPEPMEYEKYGVTCFQVKRSTLHFGMFNDISHLKHQA